eukprot:gb/GECG01007326.1/.p1 GENE.gb/GECG01007326.1/~~gb/GECG01007326.1/.p1  ORF type:complete len:698 (+),score=76.20 gb/GECG01007326.1/:1-2094(+)
MKYIVVTGGVISGLGKGISISSIGVLLKHCGLRVTSIKIDPYLNVDAGTMSPFEHGEVFVLADGGETDLDLGNYERFLDSTLTRDHNLTTGKIYNTVITSERRGDYLGKTVQVIPHITDAIQDYIERISHVPVDNEQLAPDVCLIEVGGTVGDIESLVFLEALRQFGSRQGRDNVMFLHVSLVPVMGSDGEQKTKPTQHSVKELRSLGIHPDVLICRSSISLSRDTREKLALFCQVPMANVISVHDVSNIYRVPLLMQEQGVAEFISKQLGLSLPQHPTMETWKKLAGLVDDLEEEKVVRIALVGKYTGLSDAYLSVIKALKHASLWVKRKVELNWIDASGLESRSDADDAERERCWESIKSADGILVPGGFGGRGVEGKIAAIRYAREKKIPFLGICLGMQCAVIEYARNVLGLDDAHSNEFDPAVENPVIIFMPEINPGQMGGTMRLGLRPTVLHARRDGQETLTSSLYGNKKAVLERHRHRYEVNPEYVPRIQEQGLNFVGTDERQQRMEIVELDMSVHPFFWGCQYHPEFLSHPYRPSPPFLGFILASAGIEDRTSQSIAAKISKATAGSRYFSEAFIEKCFADFVLGEKEEEVSEWETEFADTGREGAASPVSVGDGPMSSKPWASGSSSSPARKSNPPKRKSSEDHTRRESSGRTAELHFTTEAQLAQEVSTGRVNSPAVKMFSYGTHPKE